MVSETKIDESFRIESLLRFIIIESFSVPYRVDQNANGGGIMLFLRKDIFSKLVSVENSLTEASLREA